MLAALAEVDAGRRSTREVLRTHAADLRALVRPPRLDGTVLCEGRAISPGGACGELVAGTDVELPVSPPVVVLCPRIDNRLLAALDGVSAIVTTDEDPSSHAVIVCRSRGKPVVLVTAEAIRALTEPGHRRVVTVDGHQGRVLAGDCLGSAQPRSGDRTRAEIIRWCADHAPTAVFANADDSHSILQGRQRGARGHEPRLEHTLLTVDGLLALQRVLFCDPDDSAIHEDMFGDVLTAAFRSMYEAAQGQPVFMRLLDPPVHEFAPCAADVERLAADLRVTPAELQARLARTAEVNPMMGCRGVRLLLRRPDLVAVQVRSLVRAASAARVPGAPVVLITVPMVTDAEEMRAIRPLISAAAAEADPASTVEVRVGAMIETPRAALLAADIAPHVDHLAFGTNDLTAQTFALSRGDVWNRFLSSYLEQGIYRTDPFVQLDRVVIDLITTCVRQARSVNRRISFTICGEQAAHPAAIDLAYRLGIDALAVPIEHIEPVIIETALAMTAGEAS